MCEWQFSEEIVWHLDDLDLIIWPWDFSAVQYGCTS